MKTFRVVPVALTARAALFALLALIASGLLGPQQASAQGTVNFDIDPEITGNSPDTLGTVEMCYEVTCPSAECTWNPGVNDLDGVSDYIIDVVVWGDTQAPISYDVSVLWSNPWAVCIAWPDTSWCVKVPAFGCYWPGNILPDCSGSFTVGAASYPPDAGVPGDGTLVRLGLDIGASGLVVFALNAPPLNMYESASGSHPLTLGSAVLAINVPCPSAEVDLSVDSQVTGAPTDLLVSEDATLTVTTTGTHENGLTCGLTTTVEAQITHTVTAPAGCTVDGGASASDSWTGDLDGGASHVLATDFTINCSEPSTHVFVVDNEIEVLEAGYDDCDLANDTDTENVSVNVWLFGDDDYDGFTTTVEEYVGTDPLDACPDDPSDDAWPLDINMDTFVTFGGDLLPYRGRIGATGGPPADPEWLQRLDLNMDNYITIGGDLLPFRERAGESCTNP
jgi:hypothetical protein